MKKTTLLSLALLLIVTANSKSMAMDDEGEKFIPVEIDSTTLYKFNLIDTLSV